MYTTRVHVASVALALILATVQQPPRPSFAEFLAGIRAEAIARGIRAEIVDEALGHIDEPLPVVIERDRTQAETVLSLDDYVGRRLTAAFVKTATDQFARNQALATEVAARYGVPPGIIVAIWGLESNFGRFSGVRPTVAALATLAWDPRRSALFRAELLDALEIVNRGDIDMASMRGSWAGAMGQPQFMPSSYLKYAEDYDGDGRRDIWSSTGDVFASMANFLKGSGWTPGLPWGREVAVSHDAVRAISNEVAHRNGSCQARRDMTVALPMAEWRRIGVRAVDGGELPDVDATAALVSSASRDFLVTSNYDVLLEYNCAHSYAITVGLLADKLASGSIAGEKPVKGKPTHRAKKRAHRRR